MASTEDVIQYASAQRRATRVLCLFAVGVILCFVSLGASYHEYRLMGQMKSGEPVTERQVSNVHGWQFFLGLAWAVLYVAMVVAFLMWTHRSHRNLPALGALGLQFSPRGAVGWYFVPLLNLFKPYQAMREICNASQPSDSLESSFDWRGRRAPAIVRSWWALFLIMNFVANAVYRASLLADTPGAFQFVAVASMLDATITIAALLAAMRMVGLITRRQESRAAMLALSA